MSVGLAEAQAMTTVQEFEHLPGVLTAEPWRAVAADLSAGTNTHRGGIIGLAHDNQLQPVYDETSATAIPVPRAGLILGRYLAQKLDVAIGDPVWVDVLEGRRPSGENSIRLAGAAADCAPGSDQRFEDKRVMTVHSRRLVFWGTLVVTVLLGLAFAFRPQAMIVDMVTVDRGELVITVDDEGETRVHDVYELSAPVAGHMRRIVLHADDTLILPLLALFRDGPDWSVFVAADGRAELRKVEVGRRNTLDAEVLGGLDAGERVVLHPSDRVSAGVRIAERG